MSKMTTDWLTRFAQVVSGRTPGGWGNFPGSLFVNSDDDFLARTGKTQDAIFIALAGTVADEVLELVRAIKAEQECRGVIGESPNHSDLRIAVTEALAKLAAKVEQA